MVLVDESVSLVELDEALAHISLSLKTDHYGNRLTWHRKALLLESMDSLLDERNSLMRESVASLV